MNRQRLLALLLIETQAGAYGLLTGYLAVAAFIAVLAAVAGLSRTRIHLNRDQAIWVHVLVGMIFFLKYASSAPIETIDSLFLGPSLSVAIVEFLLVVQIGQLLRDFSPRPMPAEFPALGLLALICLADNQVDTPTRQTFQWLVILFVMLAAGYFGAARRRVAASGTARHLDRSFVGAIVLLVAASVGWGTASGFYRHEQRIESFLADLLLDQADQGDGMGYSGTSRLGSVATRKRREADQIALRIVADDEPGYLRGRAYDRLLFSEWVGETRLTAVSPAESAAWHRQYRPLDGQRMFPLAPVSGTLRRLEVWPDARLQGSVFAPDGAAYWFGNASHISVDDHHIIAAGDPLPGFPYICLSAKHPYDRTFTESQAAVCTTLPNQLDPRVRELAEQLFADAPTAQEKIAAVKRYFVENYEYHFGIEIPPGKDPLTYFLLERPPAHCEYFASGAAVLLRLGGVPTRYVTGFVAKEQNPIDGTWLARNRDYHAWTEAYDGDRWVLVEATPPSGVPGGNAPPRWQRMWEMLGFRLLSTRLMVQYGGLRWLGHQLLGVLAHPVTLSLSLMGLVVVAVRLRRHAKYRLVDDADVHLSQLQRLRARMDRRLARLGIERYPGETVSQFALRLRGSADEMAALGAIADWYTEYARIRYGARGDHADRLERLSDDVSIASRTSVWHSSRMAVKRLWSTE